MDFENADSVLAYIDGVVLSRAETAKKNVRIVVRDLETGKYVTGGRLTADGKSKISIASRAVTPDEARGILGLSVTMVDRLSDENFSLQEELMQLRAELQQQTEKKPKKKQA